MKIIRTLIYSLYLLTLPIGAIARTTADGAIDEDSQRSDSIVANYLKGTGIEITDNNSVKLLMSGHDKFVDMFECIRNAKSFVHLEYFNFRNDSIAGLLFNILTQKANEGVEVRALYDDFGNWSNNQPIKKAQHDSINNLGVKLVKFDPLKFPYVNHIIPRDHRKIVVVDGKVAYTGGMNVADYYIEGIEGIGPWRDMHMRIEGPAVNELHRIFATIWEDVTEEKIEGNKYFPQHIGNKGNKRVAIVDRAPKVSNESIRNLFASMLDNAKHNVRIINPYFVPTHKVRKALKRAIGRGVNVEIMLSAKSDIALTPDAAFYVANNLEKRGAKVYVFNGGFHHTKAMWVDDTFCTIGSSNMDSRSLRCDYEVNTVIFNRETIDELNCMFETDMENSDLLTRDYWKKRSTWKKFVSWFGNLLTPVL